MNAPHTGNPWIDHHASFRRADMLLAAQKAASRGSYPSLADQEEIIRLAIVGHDVMSILGGGEIIEMGPVAQAVFKLEGSHPAQIEALGFKIDTPPDNHTQSRAWPEHPSAGNPARAKTMNTESTDSRAGVASAAPCSRLSDVETELRRMAERCRKPAPSGALVLDLAADIVARSGKDAAEVIRLQNAIRSFVTDFERVDWGWDGDCGSKDLVDALFESISANTEGQTRGGSRVV